MENLTISNLSIDVLVMLSFLFLSMFYLACKTFEFFVGITFDWGWHTWNFRFSKNRQDKALAAMQATFDVRPEVIGNVKLFRLSNDYLLMFISKEHAESIIKVEKESCGTSSTTGQSSDSISTQE